MKYEFLLGRTIAVDGRTYVVIALGSVEGTMIVRASARVDGEQVMRVFPAESALRYLVADEEIELQGVSFA